MQTLLIFWTFCVLYPSMILCQRCISGDGCAPPVPCEPGTRMTYPPDCFTWLECVARYEWVVDSARECESKGAFNPAVCDCDTSYSCVDTTCPPVTATVPQFPSVPCAVDIIFCTFLGETVADRSYCSNYFRCNGTNWILEQCPVDNPFYNPVDEVCDKNPSRCDQPCEFTLPYRSTVTTTEVTTMPKVTSFTTQSTEATTHTSYISASPTESFPSVATFYPTFGPVAGGTLVAITGERLDEVQEIFIGDEMTRILNINKTHISMMTPDVNVSEAGTHYPVMLRTAYGNLDLPYTFEYRPNPVVESVYPQKTIVNGGMKIYGNGTFLNSVAEPELLITMVNETLDENGDLVIQNDTFNAPCPVITEFILTCLTPELHVDIPDDAQGINGSSIDYSTNTSSLTFYVGLALDGVDNFEFVTPIRVFIGPEFEPCDKGIEHKDNRILEIKGYNFLRGSSKEDYTITIGNDTCAILQVTDNTLTCDPPSKPPGKHGGSKRYDILVTIGRHTDVYCKLIYPLNTKAIIIGCTVSGIVVIILVIVIVLLMRKRRPNGSDQKPQETETDHIYLSPVEPEEFSRK